MSEPAMTTAALSQTREEGQAASAGMIHVPGGTYVMGSDHHYPKEAPAHRVSVDPFWIDETPVTNAQFRAFVEATGYVTFAEPTPVPVLSHDRGKEFGTTVRLLEYPSHKNTVDRDSTPLCKPVFAYGPNTHYQLSLNLSGRDVFVHRTAVGGADLWFDPVILATQFASQAVAEKLIALGYRDAVKLNPCKFLSS